MYVQKIVLEVLLTGLFILLGTILLYYFSRQEKL